jgi:hypothetical protein
MPQVPHYRKAHRLISDILGADSIDQKKAIDQTVEEMARMFELMERYQGKVSDDDPDHHSFDSRAA